MCKKLISILAIVSIFLILPCTAAKSAELSERDKKYIQVPYIAWKEISNYRKSSGIEVNIQVHSSKDFDENAKYLFIRGIQSTANKFSAVFNPNDTIHVIFATNYEDADKFVHKVNALVPGYEAYNARHLSQAKISFADQFRSYAGGTSSRNCFVPEGPYGDKLSTVIPCPKLDGGVIYWFEKTPKNGWLAEALGSHEISHIIFSKMNEMNHYRVPDWLIEGTMHSIGLTTRSNISNLKSRGTLFDPVPTWNPFEYGISYDLGKIDNQNTLDDSYSIGTLAVSLLISEVGATKFFEFMSVVGYPKQWKEVFLEIFGFSAEDFYKKFADFHSWYFYEHGFNYILNANYLASTKTKSTIICIKGKISKKITGLNPKCPNGYLKK